MADISYLARGIALLMLGLALFCSAPPHGQAQHQAPGEPPRATLRIGVLASDGEGMAVEHWSATAVYLNHTLPAYHFEITPLAFAEVEAAVRERRVDFLLANPASYVELEGRYGLNTLLTLQRRLASGEAVAVFAGAILVRAGRHDIQRLADLRGKQFVAVDKDSFGGWAMAWRQMQRAGLEPLEALASIDFAGSHENVVRAVMSGAVDAGSVRTGVLERMVASGELREGEFRVLPEESVGLHQPREFPELHSTAYYPEWPLARLAHVSDEQARQLVQALLAMPATDAAARAAAITGWIPALNYTPVHELMQELRLAQYQHYGQVALADAVSQYWRWVVAVMVVVVSLTLLILHVARLNLRNTGINRALQQELGEKAAAQRALLAQQEKLTNILESIAEAYFAVDSDWQILAMNSQAQEVFGRGRHSLVGNDLWAALPELAVIAYGSFSRSLEMGEPLEFTAYYRGSDQWLEFHTYPSGGEMGIYFRDVTTRIKAAEQLEESEQRLRAILENMLEGVITIDTRGVIQSFNHAAQTIFGYRDDEVTGKSIDMLMPHTLGGEHGGFIGSYLGGAAARVIGIGREISGQRKSGEIFPMDLSVSEILVNGQRVFVGICRDISARQRAEARAMQLATAIDHAAEGVFIADPGGRIDYVNPAYAAMHGVSSAALLGERATLFELAGQPQGPYRDFYPALQQEGRPWSGHYPVQRSGGLHYIEEATIAPVRDGQGHLSCYVGVCRDVTQTLRHEQQQLHAGRIEATATLAVSIAREFDNLLNAIIDQTSSALTQVEPHTVAGNNITQVMAAASRARVLVRQLLNFGQQEYEEPQLLRPREVVKGAVALLQSVLPATVSINQQLEEVGEIWIAPGQFQQVVTSLMLNTIKAVDDHPGTVEVRLVPRRLTAADKEVGAGLAAGDYLLLQVTDSVTLQRHTLNPGDTMALEGVQEIIQRHGGALYIDATSGQGSCFRIYMPLVAAGRT